jgi:hypothetical protein
MISEKKGDQLMNASTEFFISDEINDLSAMTFYAHFANV